MVGVLKMTLLRMGPKLLFLIWTVSYIANGQCPDGIQLPCSCATTRFEPVHITCDNAGSLANALRSIGNPGLSIDSLVVSNTVIEHLPAYAFQGYRIKRLALRGNRMTTIDQAAFDGLTRSTLEELEIRNNLITDVPQTGVPLLTSLNTLTLAKNRLRAVQPRAFEAYASKAILRKLDFSANQLHELHPEAFAGGLASLQEINFDKNFFMQIPTVALNQLSTLEDLSFGVNQLSNVPVGAIPFANLKSLSLEVNRIAQLDPNVFAGTPNLLYLYLSANNFTSVDSNMFRNVPKLKVLAMGNNALTKLPSDAFRYVPGLVRLEMSECKIDRIEQGVFQAIPKVQVIVLNKNALTQIDTTMFQSLPDLYSLDLKGNAISFISDRAFAQLRSLRHLDISSNKLQTLSAGTFLGTFERSTPPTTRVLYVYENFWQCDERLEWFRRWLRDNMDVMIDAPGYPPTVCWKPDWLRSWPIRSSNPSSSFYDTTYSWQRSTGKYDDPDKITDSWQDAQNDTELRMSTVNLTAMILGIILGVFLLTLLLLMIVRYFVSKNRREMKDRVEDDRRRFGTGSSISGYQPSGMGSAYPSPPLGDDSPTAAFRTRPPRTGYFLNRPWYWWF